MYLFFVLQAEEGIGEDRRPGGVGDCGRGQGGWRGGRGGVLEAAAAPKTRGGPGLDFPPPLRARRRAWILFALYSTRQGVYRWIRARPTAREQLIYS